MKTDLMKNDCIASAESSDFFHVMNPNESFSFANVSLNGKRQILNLMKDYLLDIRSNLNFKESLSFGLEIENENTNVLEMRKKLRYYKFKGWNIKHELSLKDGCEITSPILKDESASWKHVNSVCKIISNNLGVITSTCGGHIHFGADIFENNQTYWENFILICAAFEKTLYHFSSNEYRNIRPDVLNYAKSFFLKYKNTYKEIINNNCPVKDSNILNKMNKNYGISLTKVHWGRNFEKNNTIEFRMPNGSLNPIIWQNNVNFFGKLILYCKSESFDRNFIVNKLKKEKPASIEGFNEINYEDPFILADLIFDNNLDKVYFLRQYYKDQIPVPEDAEYIVKAKKFTK